MTFNKQIMPVDEQRMLIERQGDLQELCEHIRSCGEVAFDTEFVSDAGYRAELGLLQFATAERTVAVDPLAVESLQPWWDVMSDETTTIIVHGGQAEVRFCIQEGGCLPQRVVDIQIAEGLRSRSFPLAYAAIIERVLGVRVSSHQTRSNWLKRPLSTEQLSYALEDVSYIPEAWAKQKQWLESQGRLAWAEAEFSRMCDDVRRETEQPPWARLSGLPRLSRRELATAMELACWRDRVAQSRNRSPRRILRDDLLMDLARRRPSNEQQVLATRDLNRPDYRRLLPEILEVVESAGQIPEADLPRRIPRAEESGSDEQTVARLLALAVANRCAELDLAQALVGTNRDLLDAVRILRGDGNRSEAKLLTGWRNDTFGELLEHVISGKIWFRVAPPSSAVPLVFEKRDS